MPAPSNLTTPQALSSDQMYSARASAYDASHHPSFAAHMLSLTPPAPGAHILDLATGTGCIALPAARAAGPAGRIVALDVAEGMLAQARAKLASLQDAAPVELVRWSIDAARACPAVQAAAPFDLAVCCSALVLLDDPAAALREWRALLKPGGLLNVDVVHPRCGLGAVAMGRAVQKVGLHCPFNRDWVTGEDAVRAMVAGAGFAIREVTFVEQLGWPEGRTRMVDGRREAGVEEFGRVLGKEAWRGVDAEKVREAFLEEWEAMGEEREGRRVIEETDGVWVVVAVKE